MNSLKSPPEWLGWVVAGASLLAIADMPYGYYQLLRLVVTGYAAYLAFSFFKARQEPWAWGFGFIALLHNPVFLITMSKEFHAVVNLATAGLVVYEIRKLRNQELTDQGPRLLAGDLSSRLEPSELSGSGGQKRPSSRMILVGLAVLHLGIAAIYFISMQQNDAPPESTYLAAEAEIEQPFASENQPTSAEPSFAASGVLKVPTPATAVTPLVPSFSDFTVELSEATVPPNIARNSWVWNYRTRIRDAFSSEPNFGSNAVVTTWGCGTGCLSGALVDRTTGEVYGIPVGGEEQQMLDIQTRPGSSLLLATWNDTSAANPSCVFEAFAFVAGEFKTQVGFPMKVAGACPAKL